MKTWSSTNDGTKFGPLVTPLTMGGVGNTGTPVTFIGTSGSATDFTILRTRGIFQAIQADGTMTPGDHYMVSVGLGVIPFVTGQTAFPSPIVDADWDGWFLHETLMIGSSSAAIATESGPQDVVSRVIDSKAMRKVSGGDSLIASFDTYNSAGTTALVDVQFYARFLFKVS